MSRNLLFRAGERALGKIRSKGLSPDMVKVIAGAAGGPKYLVLTQLDREIFSSWLTQRVQPLFLVGSSIGAWRFAAVAQHNPREALEKFETNYIAQHYHTQPTAGDITRETIRILSTFLNDKGAREIVSHPFLRLSVLAVRARWPLSSDNRILLIPGIVMSALANMLSRKLLKLFFTRVLFYDSREPPPFLHMSDFPIHTIPLTVQNLKQAVIASGSIPLVMNGVRGISGAPSGTYRDGGVIDYHVDIPFLADRDDGIVLYPHYSRKIIPGWFDKKITWRNPSYMDDVLLICPSDEFVRKLPYGKIPDRNDFYFFKGRDSDRIVYWKKVIDESRKLADEFAEIVYTQKIEEIVRPL